MLKEFYLMWAYLRWIVVLLSIGLFVFLSIHCHAWGLEAEYVGPGSEAERLDRDYHEKQDRESFERVVEGRGDSRDVERAERYAQDHAA